MKGDIIMCEYEIMNKITNEVRFIFGYSFSDACRRSGYEPNDWTVIYSEYID